MKSLIDKKLRMLMFLILVLGIAQESKSQQYCGTLLGNAGGMLFQPCGTAFDITFNNQTGQQLTVYFNYFTNCSDHLIPIISLGPGAVNQQVQVPRIQSDFPTQEPEYCSPSDCVKPCYMVVELGGTFYVPTNSQFSTLPNGGTYCGWLTPDPAVCMDVQHVGPTQYVITFRY